MSQERKKKRGRRFEPSQKASIARRKVFRFIHSVRVSVGDSVKRHRSSVICWLHKNRSTIELLLYGSSHLLLHHVDRGHDEMQNV
jgi:C1A family cysteine protease